MKTLEMTVLIHDGPMARAYLGRLRRAGLRPRRAILMVRSHEHSSDKPIGRLLPRPLRQWYCEQAQQISNNFWPRKIRSAFPWLVDAMASELRRLGTHAPDLISDVVGRFDYQTSADQFERVYVRTLEDQRLLDQLSSAGPRYVLFTGGGIVPAPLLSLPKVRFLHVHPGYLPHIRGADGLLWSMLVRGRPGMSCFNMAPGIDTGDVVAADDFPPLRFNISGRDRPDDKTLYRAIFSFYDPVLRAEFLVRTLESCDGDPVNLSSTPQDDSSSVTYHFMHEALRRIVLKDLFQS